MKTSTRIRMAVYSLGVLTAACLVGASYRHEGEPDVGTLINGADILAKVGAHDKAILECEKVLKRDPGNLQAHLILALSQDRLGELDSAIETYRSSIDRCERNGDLQQEILLSVADLERRAGRFDQSLVECSRVEEQFGCSWRLELVMGLCQERLGNQDAAIHLFREAMAHEPSSNLPRFYLAAAYREAGLLERAEETLQGIIEMSPSAAAWCEVASVRAERGNPTGAIEALRNAASLGVGYTRNQIAQNMAFSGFYENPEFEEYLSYLFLGDQQRIHKEFDS